MKAMAAAWLALGAATSAAASSVPEPLVAPFVAEYDVRYGRIPGGTSRTVLARAGGDWVIDTVVIASGIARIIAPGTIRQRSEFRFEAGIPRPLRYSFDDGTKSTDRDVNLEFDWRAGQVRGVAEDVPVDVALVPELQDAATMTVLVTARLRAGREPGTIAMIEKDQVKHYRHTLLRREKLATALGELDTVVYVSTREGSSRETITWHAPGLGFAVVQAQQLVKGKLGFHTRIRSYQPGIEGDAPLRFLQVRGSVTPFWPWYLPPRSLYEVSHTSSDSKNSNCATPSFA